MAMSKADNRSTGHGSNGSPKLDGSHGPWVICILYKLLSLLNADYHPSID
jgi:hypothetical protein